MRNIRVTGLFLIILLLGAVLAQNSVARVQAPNPKGDEGKEVVTPLGFLRGKAEVVGKPEELNASVLVSAEGDHDSASANIPPNSVYVLPLAPGTYKVHAVFGSATSKYVPVTIQNGKTAQQDFSFGKKEEKQ
jgi:hypothetical protein